MFALQLFTTAANGPPALPSTFWRFDIVGISLRYTIGEPTMIGEAWDVSNPLKPWALFDTDADIKIPIGLAAWLEDLGTTYGSHEVIAPPPLECQDAGTFDPDDETGTVLVRMSRDGSAFVAGKKYPFTVRVHGADGTTQDDRTLWLKLTAL